MHDSGEALFNTDMTEISWSVPVSFLCCSGSMHGSRMHAAGSTAGSFLGSKQQQLQRNGTLGKHERDSSGTAAEHASKRFKRGAHVRAVSAGAPGRPSAIPDKHLAVGCRVAVYWRLDKVYYRVSCCAAQTPCMWLSRSQHEALACPAADGSTSEWLPDAAAYSCCLICT